MTVERLSDNQLKYTFGTSDLAERNIALGDISFSSDKAQLLFQEVLAHVQFESGFVSGGTPLMLEASRVGVDSLVVLVTKVGRESLGDDGETPAGVALPYGQKCRFKRFKELLESAGGAQEDSYSVFSFDDMDIMAAAACRLPEWFFGESMAYRLDGREYLVLRNATPGKTTTAELESVLFDYGRKHISSPLSHKYLAERGQTLIAERAVHKLKTYRFAQIQTQGEKPCQNS